MDPLAATRPPAPPPRRQGAARRTWWAVVVVLAVAAVGAAAVGLQQRGIAAQWRDRATAREAERDDAVGRTEAVQRQLEEVTAALATSEADVAALEERIRGLADEKARAEDAATTVQVQRDTVLDLTQKVAAAVDTLDSCVTQLFTLQTASVEAFNSVSAGEQVDTTALNGALEQTTAFCNTARTAAARASAATEALPR